MTVNYSIMDDSFILSLPPELITTLHFIPLKLMSMAMRIFTLSDNKSPLNPHGLESFTTHYSKPFALVSAPAYTVHFIVIFICQHRSIK